MVELATGRASEAGHWYARDGSCVYEIQSKSTGRMRPVTLADARKRGLVPGYSTIAKQEYSYNLERWKLEQMCLSALTLPDLADGRAETLEDRKARVYIDSQEQSRKAAARGTHLHAALQAHYEGAPVDAMDAPFVWPVVAWIAERFKAYPYLEWHAEKSFAHPLGYGGKADLVSKIAVVDFKFKDFDEERAVLALSGDKRWKFGYEQHEMQLHAYEKGFGLVSAIKLNLFISSTVPGLIVPHEWPTNEASWGAFEALHRLWVLRKGYNPSFDPEQIAA